MRLNATLRRFPAPPFAVTSVAPCLPDAAPSAESSAGET